jgi:hypothetical protein
MDAEYEDLIGTAPPARKSKQDRALDLLETLTKRRQDAEVLPDGVEMTKITDVMHGVTVGFLSQAFNMDPTTVRQRLKDCPTIHRKKAGFVYDLKVAAQYLVKPVLNVEEYLKKMKPSELPMHLQDTYWSAQRSRQAWEEKAGHLWATDKVMEVLGDTFQAIKFAIQLWPENVAQAHGLTQEQRDTLTKMGDALQKDIHQRLLEMPEKRKTPSSLSEMAAPDTQPAVATPDDDDYGADLI